MTSTSKVTSSSIAQGADDAKRIAISDNRNNARELPRVVLTTLVLAAKLFDFAAKSAFGLIFAGTEPGLNVEGRVLSAVALSNTLAELIEAGATDIEICKRISELVLTIQVTKTRYACFRYGCTGIQHAIRANATALNNVTIEREMVYRNGRWEILYDCPCVDFYIGYNEEKIASTIKKLRSDNK